MNKATLTTLLEGAQDKLYNADQALGGIRITKETAEVLHHIVEDIEEADQLISKAVESLA